MRCGGNQAIVWNGSRDLDQITLLLSDRPRHGEPPEESDLDQVERSRIQAEFGM